MNFCMLNGKALGYKSKAFPLRYLVGEACLSAVQKLYFVLD